MTNYGLEIHLNDNYVCRAGFENTYHVLSFIINSIRRKVDESEELSLYVGGLNAETDQHFDWINKDLKNGDRISIQIVTDNFDKPLKIREGDSKAFILKRKIEYFHKLKEELKDHLPE